MRDSQESLLGAAELAALEAFDEGASGYFGRMLDYLEHFIENGVEQERFTMEQAREDLEIALWYSYACNNIDDYEHYYMAAQWMRASEPFAKGCGAWYYRYSCALMYCGRLEESWQYAEQGVLEEPGYPWCWLQVGKLRSHFGDRSGALEAVVKGLLLEPGDFEFQTLQREVLEGRSLEEMEYHYIDPESDRELQKGVLTDCLEKQEAIAGILCDRARLEAIRTLFSPGDWEADSPYCRFRFSVGSLNLEGMFRMNEAAVSKLDLAWVREMRDKYTQKEYLSRRGRKGARYVLAALVFERDLSIGLLYQNTETEEWIPISIQRDGELYSTKPESLLVDLGFLAPGRGEIPKRYEEWRRLSCWTP